MCRNIKLIAECNAATTDVNMSKNRRFKPQLTVSALCCVCPISCCWGVDILKIPSFYLCATSLASPSSLCLLNPSLRPHHGTGRVLGGCVQAVPVAGPQGLLLHIPDSSLCNRPDCVDHVCGEMTTTERRDKDGLIDRWQKGWISLLQGKIHLTYSLAKVQLLTHLMSIIK